MRKISFAISFMLILSGCANVAYRVREEISSKYIAPQEKEITKNKSFEVSYDEVWEAIMAYFAFNNIPIKTVEKESGIIVAERTLDKSQDLKKMVDTGYLQVKKEKYREKMVSPPGVMCTQEGWNYLDPEYLKQYGRVESSEKINENLTQEKINADITSTYNIFARKRSDGVNVSVNINFKIIGNNKNYKVISTGWFEEQILNHIKNYLEKK